MTRLTPRFLFWILAATLAFVLAACSGPGDVVPETTAELAVTAQGTGSGSVTSAPAGIECGAAGSDCSQTYDLGTAVTLTAAAAEGSTFAGWDGACTGSAATCEVTLDDDVSVTANFTLIDDQAQYTVTVAEPVNGTVASGDGNINCGGGNVTCEFVYQGGDTVELTATAAEGFTFSGWSGGACDSSTEATCSFTISADQQISAMFNDPNAMPGEYSAAIASSSDDAEEFVNDPAVIGFPAGTTYTTSSDLELSYDTGSGTGSNQVIGLRFTGVTVPAGATITEAYIQFTARETDSTNTTLTIFAQDHANPDTFVAAQANNNISDRARTAASVTWTPAAWSAGASGAAERTPNLAELVQAVVDLGDWAEGNAIAFIITGPDTTTNQRTADSFDEAATSAPVLTIRYTTAQ
jgi:uncharacterized repeat protein (TIGR02543 family)